MWLVRNVRDSALLGDVTVIIITIYNICPWSNNFSTNNILYDIMTVTCSTAFMGASNVIHHCCTEKKCVDVHQKRWQLSCHPLSFDVSLLAYFPIKQLEANVSPETMFKHAYLLCLTIIVIVFLPFNTIDHNIVFKVVERIHQNTMAVQLPLNLV